MAKQFRGFVGYSIDELQELLPLLEKDEKFAIVTFRPDQIKTVYISRNPRCKYIGVQYSDDEIVLTDGIIVSPTSILRLFDVLNCKFTSP